MVQGQDTHDCFKMANDIFANVEFVEIWIQIWL
jgi:hypothetical protein